MILVSIILSFVHSTPKPREGADEDVEQAHAAAEQDIGIAPCEGCDPQLPLCLPRRARCSPSATAPTTWP